MTKGKESNNSFSKRKALLFAWGIMKRDPWTLVSITALIMLVSIVFSFAGDAIKGTPALEWVIFAIGWIVQIFLILGFYHVVLGVVRGGSAEVSEIFSQRRLFFSYLGAMILTGLTVVAGLILFVVPGVIFAIMFIFYPFVIVDHDAGPIEAMRESADITRGSRWNLFFFWMLLAILNLLGVLLFGIGLLVTIPFTMIAAGYVYDKLRDNLAPAL